MGCPSSCVPYHITPYLSLGGFACHCVACCSILSLLGHFPITGCVMHSLLCSLSPHTTVSSQPSPEVGRLAPAFLVPVRDKKRGMGPLCTFWSCGKCMDLLVGHLL